MLLACWGSRTPGLPHWGAPRQYTKQQEYDRMMTVLRNAFDPDELGTLLLAGASMTDDEAIHVATS